MEIPLEQDGEGNLFMGMCYFISLSMVLGLILLISSCDSFADFYMVKYSSLHYKVLSN